VRNAHIQETRVQDFSGVRDSKQIPSILLAPRRLKQGDHEFRVSLGYITRLYLKDRDRERQRCR
jgi:hypothetical protein